MAYHLELMLRRGIAFLPQHRVSIRHFVEAGSAAPMNFNERPHWSKSLARCYGPHGLPDTVLIEMLNGPAGVADQEDAIVHAARMRVGNVGIAAFDPQRDILSDEQVQNAVDAIGSNPPSELLAYQLSDIIGAGGGFQFTQRSEHCSAHLGPLLTVRFHRLGSSQGEVPTLGQRMLMLRHRHGADMTGET